MNADTATPQPARGKITLWLLVGAGLLLLAAANFHLVYVAFSSQPDCVAHVRQGEGVTHTGQFSAAQSSCSPR